MNGLIEKKEMWLLLIFDILTAPWLYLSIENNELLDNVNGSTENREFFEDVEE